MKTIVCIDDKFGVSFDGKRQSRDRVLIEDLMDFIGCSRLIISPFSATLFDGLAVEINDAPFDVAQADDFVFCEAGGLLAHLERINEVIIYKWNRTYPRDVLLDLLPWEHGFKLIDRFDFVGSSHKKITREVYRK